jgi:hypothetical protein
MIIVFIWLILVLLLVSGFIITYIMIDYEPPKHKKRRGRHRRVNWLMRIGQRMAMRAFMMQLS